MHEVFRYVMNHEKDSIGNGYIIIKQIQVLKHVELHWTSTEFSDKFSEESRNTNKVSNETFEN